MLCTWFYHSWLFHLNKNGVCTCAITIQSFILFIFSSSSFANILCWCTFSFVPSFHFKLFLCWFIIVHSCTCGIIFYLCYALHLNLSFMLVSLEHKWCVHMCCMNVYMHTCSSIIVRVMHFMLLLLCTLCTSCVNFHHFAICSISP